MSARMKLLTQSPRSGSGKAKYHDVPPEHVFHRQQRADNVGDNKGTSCSSSLCLVFGVWRFPKLCFKLPASGSVPAGCRNGFLNAAVRWLSSLKSRVFVI